MIEYMDTHCHIYFDDYDEDREVVIERANTLGVTYLMNVGVDIETSQKAIEIATLSSNYFATVGLHPHSSHEANDEVYKKLTVLAASNKCVKAIGEIGLDYYKSEATPELQQQVMGRMCELAKDVDLPIVIHSRNAFEDTLKIIKKELKGGDTKAVFHCFSYDTEAMNQIVDLGHYVSFSGIVTFKSAKDLQECARLVPQESFLIETDSPYLTPTPNRGKRNEPAFLEDTARYIAQLRGVSPDEIKYQSLKNAKKLFNI